jgi:aminoglycoside phosphotransferase family enzyme
VGTRIWEHAAAGWQACSLRCIEFNERFRWIDVLSEVAFTVMDLEDRGNPAAARRLLSSTWKKQETTVACSCSAIISCIGQRGASQVTSIRLDQEDILPDGERLY